MKLIVLILIIAAAISCITYAQQSDCDYKVEILIDGEEFDAEEFTWRMKATKIEGVPTNITGTAEIQSNGKTVKSYKPFTSDPISRQKTSSEYSPNLKPGNYEITAEINVECDDTNKDNNVDTKEIKIKGEVETKSSNNDNDEEKETETNEKENIETTPNEVINEEFLDPPPQKTAAKKPAEIEETENTIQLTANNNKNKAVQSTALVVQQPQIVYESSNEKIKGLIMIFLLTLSILLNIILIWKR